MLSFRPHNGRDVTFAQLIQAIILVYNISYPLAFLLASVGFLTSGKLSVHGVLSKPQTHSHLFMVFFSCLIKYVGSLLATHIFPHPPWTLDLQSLSQRGSVMIAHDGSLVHPDGKPSTAPDPIRIENLLQQASTARNSKGDLKGGLDFFDIVRIHTEHVLSTAHPTLSKYHEQVSQGECSLLWEILRDRADTSDEVISTYKLRQWLGEERLPDEWWYSRPTETVGLLRARKTANEVAKLSKQIAEEAGIRKLPVHDAELVDCWSIFIYIYILFLHYFLHTLIIAISPYFIYSILALLSTYMHYYIALLYRIYFCRFVSITRVKFCSDAHPLTIKNIRPT